MLKNRDARLYVWSQEKGTYNATHRRWCFRVDDDGASDPERRYYWQLLIRDRMFSLTVDSGFSATLEKAQEEVVEALHKLCDP